MEVHCEPTRWSGRKATRDYLKGAELAFKDDLLADLLEEVIRTARKPDGIWREAKRRLPGDKALASSYWWLAKFKRDYPDEFYAKILETEKREMTEKGSLMEIALDSSISVLSSVAEYIEVQDSKNIRRNLDNARSKLAELVEEKFKLKVRTCVNCRYYRYDYHAPGEFRGGVREDSRPIYCCQKSGRPVERGDSCMGSMLNGVINCWETR